MQKFDDMMEWLAGLYVNTLNIIHYMHDKYSYEKLMQSHNHLHELHALNHHFHIE